MKIMGIDIDLHWTFLILLALVFITGGIDSIIIAVVLFSSVILHELSHSFVARKYNIQVKRIILLPIGGMAVIDEFGMPAEVELRVAIAGPALSLVLAIFFALVTFFSPFPWLTVITAVATEANAMLCLFNLLPAIPMDGGRVWRALRQRKKSFLAATRDAVALSKFTVFILFVGGLTVALLFNAWVFLFWNLLIALFIYAGAGMEWDTAVFKAASEGITVRDAMRRDVVCASGEETLLDAFELAYKAKIRNLLLVSKTSFGVVPLSSFQRVPHGEWGKKKIKSMANAPIRCTPDEGILEAWKKMKSSGVEIAPVLEGKKLVGLVSETDIERVIYLRKLTLVP